MTTWESVDWDFVHFNCVLLPLNILNIFLCLSSLVPLNSVNFVFLYEKQFNIVYSHLYLNISGCRSIRLTFVEIIDELMMDIDIDIKVEFGIYFSFIPFS